MSGNLAGVSSTIGTVVGLGITLGALGLAFEFADRAIDRTAPRRNGKRAKRRPLFDTSYGYGNTSGKRKRSNNIFDPMGSTSRSRSRKNDVFGGELF